MVTAWAFERGKFWAIDLDDAGKTTGQVSPGVAASFAEAAGDSVQALALAMGTVDALPVRNRLASGRRCFMACVSGRVVAYCWVSTISECIGELEHEVQLPDGEAYIWDCVTLPEFRGKHLYLALLAYIVDVLRGEGLRRVWIGSSLDNIPSIRAFTRAGFQPVMTVYYARLLMLSLLLSVRSPDAVRAHVLTAHKMLVARNELRWGPLRLGFPRTLPLLACI